MVITIEKMWQDGPLRLFCPDKTRPNSGFIPYHSQIRQGFVGAYVCAKCGKTCDGVYRVGKQWLGGCCR